MAKYDWILNRAKLSDVPDIKPFADRGMNGDNTVIGDYDDYVKDNRIITNPIFKDSNGAFSEEKFARFYNAEVQTYNKLCNRQFDYKYEDHVKFTPYSGLAETPEQLVDTSVDNPSFSFVSNPFLSQKGYLGIENNEDSSYSVRELAQGNSIFDNSIGEWVESPDVIGFFGAANPFHTYALATWDEDGYHIDPVTGATVPHSKGEYKTGGERGTFYYEDITGENVTGRILLNPMSVITVDGSDFDKYNFLDSDDKDKSIAGTTASTLFDMALYLTSAGKYIAGAKIALSCVDIAGKVIGGLVDLADNNSLFGDAVDLSSVSSFFNAFDGAMDRWNPEVSDYSQENMLTYENLGHVISEVVLQNKEMRTIMDWYRGGKSNILGKNGVSFFKTELATAMENESKFLAEKEAEFLPQLREFALNDRAVVGAITKAETEAVAKRQAMQYLNGMLEKATKDGERFSKLWMTGEVVKTTYSEARAEGASPEEAALMGLLHAVTEFGIMNLGVSEHILPELKAERTKNRMLIERILGIANEQGDRITETMSETGVRKFWRKLVDGMIFNKGPYSRGILGGFAGGLAEAVEEDVEELDIDLIKWLDSKVFGTYDNPFTFDNDFFSRYFMNALGGFIGGFVGNFESSFQAAKAVNTMSEEDAWQGLVEVVRNGGKKDLLEELGKMQLGSSTLSNLEVKGVNKEVYYKPAGKDILSQNEENHNRISDAINFIEEAIGSHNTKSNNEMTKELLQADVRYLNFVKSSSMKHFFSDYNQKVADIVKLDAEISALNSEIKGTDPSELLAKQAKLAEVKEGQKKLIEELHNEYDSPTVTTSGKPGLSNAASKHLELAMWEMTNMAHAIGLDFSATSIAEILAKKSWKDMGDYERNKYIQKAIELKKKNGFDYVRGSYDIAKKLMDEYAVEGTSLFEGLNKKFNEANYMADVINKAIYNMAGNVKYLTGENNSKLITSEIIDIRDLLESAGAIDVKNGSADILESLIQKVGVKVNGEWGYYDAGNNFVKAGTVWNEAVEKANEDFRLLEDMLADNAAQTDPSKKKSTLDVFADSKLAPSIVPFSVDVDGEEVLDVNMMKAYKNAELLVRLLEDIKGQGLPMTSFSNAAQALLSNIDDMIKEAPRSKNELETLKRRIEKLHANPRKLTNKIINQICKKIDSRTRNSKKDLADLIEKLRDDVKSGNIIEPVEDYDINDIKMFRDAINDMRAIVTLCAQGGPSVTPYNNVSFTQWINEKNAMGGIVAPKYLVIDYNDMLGIRAYLDNLDITCESILKALGAIGENRLQEDLFAAINFKRKIATYLSPILSKIVVPDDKKDKLKTLNDDLNEIMKFPGMNFSEITNQTESKFAEWHLKWVKFEQHLHDSGLYDEFKAFFSDPANIDIFPVSNMMYPGESSVEMTESDNLIVTPDQIIGFIFSRFKLSPLEFYTKLRDLRNDPTNSQFLLLKSQEETLYQASVYAADPSFVSDVSEAHNKMILNAIYNKKYDTMECTLAEATSLIDAILRDTTLTDAEQRQKIEEVGNKIIGKVSDKTVKDTITAVLRIWMAIDQFPSEDEAKTIIDIMFKQKSWWKKNNGFVIEGGAGTGKSTAIIKFALGFRSNNGRVLSTHVSKANAEKNAKMYGLTNYEAFDKDGLLDYLYDSASYSKPGVEQGHLNIDPVDMENYYTIDDDHYLTIKGTQNVVSGDGAIIVDEYTALSETEVTAIIQHDSTRNIPVFLVGDLFQNSISFEIETDEVENFFETGNHIPAVERLLNNSSYSGQPGGAVEASLIFPNGMTLEPSRSQYVHAPRLSIGMRAANFHKAVNNNAASKITSSIINDFNAVTGGVKKMSDVYPTLQQVGSGVPTAHKKKLELISSENATGFWGDRIMFADKMSAPSPGNTISDDVFNIADKMIQQLDQSSTDPSLHEKIVLCESDRNTHDLEDAFRVRYGVNFDKYFELSTLASSQGNENAYYISFDNNKEYESKQLPSVARRLNTALSRAKKGSLYIFQSDNIIYDDVIHYTGNYSISQFFSNGSVGNREVKTTISDTTFQKHQNQSNKRVDNAIRALQMMTGTAASSAPGPYPTNPVPYSLNAPADNALFFFDDDDNGEDQQFSLNNSGGSPSLVWNGIDFSNLKTYTTHKSSLYDANRINTVLNYLNSIGYYADSDIYGFFNVFGRNQASADLYNTVRTLVLSGEFDKANQMLGSSGFRFEYKTTRRTDNQVEMLAEANNPNPYINPYDNLGSSGLYITFDDPNCGGGHSSSGKVDVLIAAIPDVQNILGRIITALNKGNQNAIDDANRLMGIIKYDNVAIANIISEVDSLLKKYNAPQGVIDIFNFWKNSYFGNYTGLNAGKPIFDRISTTTQLDTSTVRKFFGNDNSPVVLSSSRLKDADTEYPVDAFMGKTIAEVMGMMPGLIHTEPFVSSQGNGNLKPGSCYVIVSYNPITPRDANKMKTTGTPRPGCVFVEVNPPRVSASDFLEEALVFNNGATVREKDASIVKFPVTAAFSIFKKLITEGFKNPQKRNDVMTAISCFKNIGKVLKTWNDVERYFTYNTATKKVSYTTDMIGFSDDNNQLIREYFGDRSYPKRLLEEIKDLAGTVGVLFEAKKPNGAFKSLLKYHHIPLPYEMNKNDGSYVPGRLNDTVQSTVQDWSFRDIITTPFLNVDWDYIRKTFSPNSTQQQAHGSTGASTSYGNKILDTYGLKRGRELNVIKDGNNSVVFVNISADKNKMGLVLKFVRGKNGEFECKNHDGSNQIIDSIIEELNSASLPTPKEDDSMLSLYNAAVFAQQKIVSIDRSSGKAKIATKTDNSDFEALVDAVLTKIAEGKKIEDSMLTMSQNLSHEQIKLVANMLRGYVRPKPTSGSVNQDVKNYCDMLLSVGDKAINMACNKFGIEYSVGQESSSKYEFPTHKVVFEKDIFDKSKHNNASWEANTYYKVAHESLHACINYIFYEYINNKNKTSSWINNTSNKRLKDIAVAMEALYEAAKKKISPNNKAWLINALDSYEEFAVSLLNKNLMDELNRTCNDEVARFIDSINAVFSISTTNLYQAYEKIVEFMLNSPNMDNFLATVNNYVQPAVNSNTFGNFANVITNTQDIGTLKDELECVVVRQRRGGAPLSEEQKLIKQMLEYVKNFDVNRNSKDDFINGLEAIFAGKTGSDVDAICTEWTMLLSTFNVNGISANIFKYGGC